MHTIKRFRSIYTFRRFLRRKGGYLPDEIIVNKIPYTMENYDMEGRRVDYRDAGYGKIIVKTHDRYTTLKDAEVEEYNLENIPL